MSVVLSKKCVFQVAKERKKEEKKGRFRYISASSLAAKIDPKRCYCRAKCSQKS
jgi:hypothetical protein